MTYSGQFLKITWGFTVLGTDEIADTSLNYTTAPGWTGAVAALGEIATADIGLDLIGDMASFIAQVGWADYSSLQSVKVAAVGTDGHYLAEPYLAEDTTPGHGDQTQLPPQLTMCMSLRSGFTLGGGNYGRMYVPHTRPGLDTGSPYIPTSSMADLAGYGKTFVNNVTDDVNGATTAVLFPAIMSNKGAGTGKGVTQVGFGRVVDTQRRRRNRLDDAATLVSLA
uniref:Uncharacterized protein n=1 Tax=uncultured prokaryote TaxID=198431 RepID=A0A0H5Q212_9ZZZZ|nr:hypothetical protein [uncultured prokaryote]